MGTIRYGLLAGLGLVLAGCGLPPALMVASYVADGVLLAASGKTIGDHALSTVVQQDCAMWRVLKGEGVCRDAVVVDAGGILTASGDDETGEPIAEDDAAAIQLAQAYLNNLGYEAGPIDGVSGPQTQDAIVAFEADAGIVPDGNLTYADLASLGNLYGTPETTAAPLPIDDGYATVLLAQAHLSYFGYEPGPLDGIVGLQTRSAAARFQHDKGLDADGQVTPLLLLSLQQDIPAWNARSIAAAPELETIQDDNANAS